MTWKFDKNIASIFTCHARQHIPNYDQVINQCVDIANKIGKDAKIIDVGCATGETLRKLYNNDFKNLYGIDSSEDMLANCATPYANLICSDTFVTDNGTFDLVLMNWTLHFIKDKVSYLKNIYDHLNPGGIVVLSEKVSLDPYAIEFYHQYKREHGVSNDEIKNKEEAIKDIMYIDNVEWYLKTFKELGFTKAYIVNSHWCFTTFVCIK